MSTPQRYFYFQVSCINNPRSLNYSNDLFSGASAQSSSLFFFSEYDGIRVDKLSVISHETTIAATEKVRHCRHLCSPCKRKPKEKLLCKKHLNSLPVLGGVEFTQVHSDRYNHHFLHVHHRLYPYILGQLLLDANI